MEDLEQRAALVFDPKDLARLDETSHFVDRSSRRTGMSSRPLRRLGERSRHHGDDLD